MKIINLGSGSSGNAYIVESESGRFLLECGFRYKTLLEKSDFNLPEICFLTHEHGDHAKGADEYLKWGNTIITSKGTKEKLRPGYNCKAVEPKKQNYIKDFCVIAFETEHDATEPFGYFIQDLKSGEALLFATDTYFLRYKFQGITHILIECNFDRETLSETANDKHLERVFESHMSLQDLKIMLQANDLSKCEGIYLAHMSNDNLDPEKALKEIKELTGLPVYLCLRDGGFFE